MRVTPIIIVILDKSVPVVSILALPKLIKWTEQVKDPNKNQEETIYMCTSADEEVNKSLPETIIQLVVRVGLELRFTRLQVWCPVTTRPHCSTTWHCCINKRLGIKRDTRATVQGKINRAKNSPASWKWNESLSKCWHIVTFNCPYQNSVVQRVATTTH